MIAFTLAATGAVVMGQEAPKYTIVSVTPTSGPIGTVVTMAGSSLGVQTTSVKFNGVTANFKSTKVYEIQAIVPTGATTGPIVCSGPMGSATSPQAFNVTTSSGGNGGGNTTNIVPPPPHIPRPINALTSHPRMWVRGSDIPRLQSWAVPSNHIWQDLQSVANLRKSQMNQGIVPNQDSGDGEGNAYPYATEEIAELFAFMSMVDPVASNRADWAKRAHDLLMFVMNQAVLGPAANQKFRTPKFATFNRSRWYGEAFPLVVDWCYNTFSAAEKVTIRKVFVRWTHEILDYNVAGGSYTVSPAGVVNNSSLLGKGQQRWAANNYWCNHARDIAMMSLALDDQDDVPSFTGDYPSGYLGDYIGNAIGAWMYVRNFADTHELAGGISPEGPGYSESSFSGLTMMMLALHTAGYDNVGAYGPAAGMINNPFWTHEVTDAYIHSLSPQTAKMYSWQPPMYLPAGFGDVLRFETIDMIRAFGPLAAIDIADGNSNSQRLNDVRWIQSWLAPGGMASLDNRLTSSPNNYGTMLPILYFLTFDPKAAPPADPRNALSTNYFAPSLNRLLSRSDWSTNASWFTFISGFNSIDHQWGDSNSFSFYRKGEFLTKEWSGYGKNIGAVDFQNNVSIDNPPLVASSGFVLDEAAHGSQYSYMSDGDPIVKTSFGTDYVFAEGDATKRYNSTQLKATDVQHASRSIFWLKPDVVVVYDRADSKTAGHAKRFSLNLANHPIVTGNTAVAVTPQGQQVAVSSLLPMGGTMKWDQPSTTWGWNESTPEELMHFRVQVEDLAKPMSVRFLNVIEGLDAGAPTIPTSLASNVSGSAYDGAVVGNTCFMFAKTLGQTFTGLTYTVPSTTTTNFVTGLTPGVGYSVSTTNGGNGLMITLAVGGPIMPDAAGVIRL